MKLYFPPYVILKTNSDNEEKILGKPLSPNTNVNILNYKLVVAQPQ